MKIAITGATGLVGGEMVKALVRKDNEVARLLRPGGEKKHDVLPAVYDISWDAASGNFGEQFDRLFPQGVDAVINLAGASVADGRWTEKRKALLRSSRIGTTRGLVQSMAKCELKPRVLISASAVGYYGDRGDEILTETSGAGTGFLAGLAEEWEAEARKAEPLGVRVVLARFGIILAKQGGALPKMMTPFKLGIGGKLGSGRQWLPWVTLDDVVTIVSGALVDSSIVGAINVVSPAPVTNAEFTKSLARAMHRPAIFSVPAFALRLAVGEMADEGLLSSARAVPQKLKHADYIFLHADLDEALRAILNEVAAAAT
jgi:uncharacterized protein (TIGR01777 family)